MERIEDARTIRRYRDTEEYRRWLEAIARRLHGQPGGMLGRLGLRRAELVPPLGRVQRDAAPAVAYVNHGRWVADCPTPGCGGALEVADDLPGFWCPYCENRAVGGAWRPIQWPSERAAIEALLRRRPAPATANWWPWESLADLWRENREHGVE